MIAVTYKRHPVHGTWFIGDNGSAFQTHFGKIKILNPTPNSRGYVKIRMKVNGASKAVSLHRLVSETFLGISELEVNHKNKIRSDNRLENLEYCTRSQNVRHSQIGRKKFVYPVTNDHRFCVQIMKDKEYIRAGRLFETKKEAYSFAHKMYVDLFGFEPWSIL